MTRSRFEGTYELYDILWSLNVIRAYLSITLVQQIRNFGTYEHGKLRSITY